MPTISTDFFEDVAPEHVATELHECVVSVVTSALNEADNVRAFLDQVCLALKELGVSGEIIFVDDGSSDNTGQIASDYAVDHPEFPIHVIRHWRPRGLAAGITEGAALAHGHLVCFLPADLESAPAEDIPKLFHAMDAETDVVVGRRVGRGDGKRVASGVYNRLNSMLFGVKVRDGNWIKMIRGECLKGVRLRNDWHPFLVPILAHARCRIKEVDTTWYARSYGQS
jgi:glycosyltransferase involved in cell wall biosynthesis